MGVSAADIRPHTGCGRGVTSNPEAGADGVPAVGELVPGRCPDARRSGSCRGVGGPAITLGERECLSPRLASLVF